MMDAQSSEKLSIQAFRSIVSDDVVSALRSLMVEDSPYLRRNLVRTVMSAAEGMLWDLKQNFVVAPAVKSLLTAEEIMFMTDTTYVVNERGQIRVHDKFISLETNVRACARVAHRLTPEFSIGYDSAAWQCFTSAIEIRNRITHPKKQTDFLVGDIEFVAVLRGWNWIQGYCLRIMRQVLIAANVDFDSVDVEGALLRVDRLANIETTSLIDYMRGAESFVESADA